LRSRSRRDAEPGERRHRSSQPLRSPIEGPDTSIIANFLPRLYALARQHVVVATLAVAFCLVLASLLVGGLEGLGPAATIVQGLAQLLFLAAFAYPVIAGRISRGSPSKRRAQDLFSAFGAGYGAYLALALLNTVAGTGAFPLVALIFVGANALVLACLLTFAGTSASRTRTKKTIHALALLYFWSSFLLLDFLRIGQSRLTDPFFVTAFALLVAAMAVRVSVLWSRSPRRLAEKVGH
jgi:hypothetical protein